jgi:hypothetical protein
MISCVGDGQYFHVVLSCAKTRRLADDHIHIWNRQSGAQVHRIPAEVRVADGSRRTVAWSSSQANVVKFATVGEKALRIWSADQTNSVAVASSSGKSPPRFANLKSNGEGGEAGESTRGAVGVGGQEQTTSRDSLYDREETLSTGDDPEKSDQGIR